MHVNYASIELSTQYIYINVQIGCSTMTIIGSAAGLPSQASAFMYFQGRRLLKVINYCITPFNLFAPDEY